VIRVLSLLFSGVFGGPHNRSARIAPILEQHGVRLLAAIPDEPGNALERLRGAGVEVITVPTHRLRRTLGPSAHVRFAAGFWRDVGIIRQVVRERQIDAILINGAAHPHGAIAGRREGIAVVWQIIEDLPGALKYAMAPLMMRYADVVMTTGMTLATSYPWITRFANRLISFFPPVDLAVFRPHADYKAAARRELGLPSESLVIGTVGNINPDNDHRNFIRAAAALKRRSPEAKFVILGATYKERAAYSEGLWREAQALGLRPGHDLVVRNPGTAVARLAQAFDIFWLTSRAEGVPAAVGEAMAMALPIVATDVGSVREAVREGNAGFVVAARNPQAIADATLPLINDADLRAKLGQSGRRFAQERFHVKVCADLHLRALEMAMQRRHRPHSDTSQAPTGASAIS
jgi:glycosyltransferase involved in cell wall biosynthesis